MANKQKNIIKDVKSALIEVLERVAKNGGLITYSELICQVAGNSQCEKEFADPVKGGRRRLVDYLDKINLDSANDKGVLLSVDCGWGAWNARFRILRQTPEPSAMGVATVAVRIRDDGAAERYFSQRVVGGL